MADKGIPDYLRDYDLDQDWGFTPVNKAPESTPAVDTSVIETNNVELARVKSDVGDIKSMMNEIMQIVAEKDEVTKTLSDEDTLKRFKEILTIEINRQNYEKFNEEKITILIFQKVK